MSSDSGRDRRDEILELYRQGTITAEEMERLLSNRGETEQAATAPTAKAKRNKRLIFGGLAAVLIVGTSAAIVLSSGGDSQVSQKQVQSEIDSTRQSLIAQTTTTDWKAAQRRKEAADYQAKMDACYDKGYATEVDKLIQEELKKLLTPKSSMAQLRATAVLIGKQHQAYETVLAANMKSDLLSSDAAEVARLASETNNAFRTAATFANRDDFTVAFTESSLVADDLRRAVVKLIENATKFCGGN